MKKFWLIFWNEYKRHVMRKRFIFAILSMPFFVGLMVLIGFVSVWLQFNDKPVGYIDSYDILEYPQQVPKKEKSIFDPVKSVAYPDEESAKAAMIKGEIQAYFILQETYRSTGEVTMVSNIKPGNNARGDFGEFLSYNIIKGLPEPVIKRLNDGNKLIIRSLDGAREIGAENWMVMLLPLLAGVLFIIAVNVSGGYLLQAVVEEKENRTMEILVTSVSPDQLMAGKVVGNLMVGLTELAIWIVFTVIGLTIAPLFFDIGAPPPISLTYILLLVGTLLPAFVMVAAAMGAIGSTATEMREAQQIAGWFTLPIVVPFWFVTPIMFNPNGSLAVWLSLFPLTAPIALPLRAVFTDVPWWQIVTTITLLCALAYFSLWLSGRVFRIGMLRYGKKVSLKEAFKRS
ncbi:MAG: ABC-2 type transport system permease protein [Chloroflexi bacterium]|nr:MAG: ABC-2 type transport system permease protein [Chloroflexota bacterium]